MENTRQAVATIEEPNGHLRYISLPYYLDEGSDTEVTKAMVQLANCMASHLAGAGTVLDIEWMGDEEL